MAKVLAFDVGIKNLSYCLMEDCDILDWDLIDLTDDGSESTTREETKTRYAETRKKNVLFRTEYIFITINPFLSIRKQVCGNRHK